MVGTWGDGVINAKKIIYNVDLDKTVVHLISTTK